MVTVDLGSFTQKFQQDSLLRTQVAGALASRLRADGITSRDAGLNLHSTSDGAISELTIGMNSNDPLVQLQVANAALEVLRENGVTDLNGISGLDPLVNPRAWNVIYKDGGWIINGRRGRIAN
ncbi:hypothetical protein ACH4SP_13415 [Streptomyces sp. NPDC021093]|uniref:hypothetical protein n=1 Tax=Streptomyces sp. NPDC021093 TaxID=3365112 RepID=UPI0037BAFDEE